MLDGTLIIWYFDNRKGKNTRMAGATLNIKTPKWIGRDTRQLGPFNDVGHLYDSYYDWEKAMFEQAKEGRWYYRSAERKLAQLAKKNDVLSKQLVAKNRMIDKIGSIRVSKKSAVNAATQTHKKIVPRGCRSSWKF